MLINTKFCQQKYENNIEDKRTRFRNKIMEAANEICGITKIGHQQVQRMHTKQKER